MLSIGRQRCIALRRRSISNVDSLGILDRPKEPRRLYLDIYEHFLRSVADFDEYSFAKSGPAIKMFNAKHCILVLSLTDAERL